MKGSYRKSPFTLLLGVALALLVLLSLAPAAAAQTCSELGGTFCSHSRRCPPAYVSLGPSDDCVTCCVEDEPPPDPSCGELGGDYCSQSGACPSGYDSLGVTYDCNPCCRSQAPPGPSCGEIGGDYCSQSGNCPPGYISLGATYDCNPCCDRIPVDDAEVVSSRLPSRLRCGRSFEASVTMRNTGSSTWTEADEYRLGAVDDSDDLSGPGRVFLPPGVTVPPQGTHEFPFTLTAPPDGEGPYFTDWRMVHEGVRWFGQTAERTVEVFCPAPPALPPLRIVGNRFYAGNSELKLIGAADSGGAPDTPKHVTGWPFISNNYIQKFREHRLNYVHIRTGPFTRNPPNPDGEAAIFEGYRWHPDAGKYDLNQFERAFVDHLRSTLGATLAAGIYTEIDLVDTWTTRHDASPFNGNNNINGLDSGTNCEMFRSSPNSFVAEWVRHVVRETANYPHVFYQVGNETGLCRSTSEFELGVYTIAKDEMARIGVNRPVGTNSGHDGLDYRTYHGFFVPVPEPIPVLVNETDNGFHSPEEYAYRMRLGLQRGGVYFQGWRGPLPRADFERLLELIRDIMNGTPDPPGMACPRLRGTIIKVHNVPAPGRYVIDASPVGLGDEGSDHRQFCEQVYYDGPTERGPRWRIVGGSGDGEVNPRNPFLFTAYPSPSMQIQACTQSGDYCSNILTVP